jgi:TATA-box binding protein (TBP) (component of TFIID and TFIIIB)
MKPKKGEVVTIIKPGYKINFIKPCVTERGKKMAEAFLNVKKLNMDMLFETAKKAFSSVKYSKELGLIRITFNKKAVLIFDSGKVVIRRAENERDVIETVEKIAGLIG